MAAVHDYSYAEFIDFIIYFILKFTILSKWNYLCLDLLLRLANQAAS